MRVGGMVKKDSIIISQKEIQFIVTDFENEILRQKEKLSQFI